MLAEDPLADPQLFVVIIVMTMQKDCHHYHRHHYHHHYRYHIYDCTMIYELYIFLTYLQFQKFFSLTDSI